jgi:hypothetical protein
MQFICRLYGLFLKLFPRTYREEYGDELQAVFNLMLEDAARQNGLEFAGVVLQEFFSLPKAIIHEHLRKPRYSLAAQALILEKDSYMKTMPKIEWEELGSWKATIASLLPLWLFFFAYTNLSGSILEILEIIAFSLIIPVCIVSLLKGWMTFDLLLYSFLPIPILFLFDEIDWSFRISILLFCTLILTVGIVGYQRSLNKDSVTLAWLSLLLAAVAAWIFASHAVQNYWKMGNEISWWVLLFSF